jgi:hypothetical protein
MKIIVVILCPHVPSPLLAINLDALHLTNELSKIFYSNILSSGFELKTRGDFLFLFNIEYKLTPRLRRDKLNSFENHRFLRRDQDRYAENTENFLDADSADDADFLFTVKNRKGIFNWKIKKKKRTANF